MAKMANYIGLMSGTSMDGVDAVVVASDCKTVLASVYLPYSETLKAQLKSLAQHRETSLKALAELDVKVAQAFVQATKKLLAKARLSTQEVRAIGSHGQTIYHEGGTYSMQIGHGALIAEQTGITTVADFRMQDVAAGGQGAPLTPIYHQHLLNNEDGVVLNLGGIANITLVKNGVVSGFDTGPANTLLDAWVKKTNNADYDENGTWARSGKVNEALLEALLKDDYFAQQPPKSTGTEHFNLNWLSGFLNKETPADVQRTLVDLSAISVAQHMPKCANVYLCGGGVHNTLLVERLVHHSPSNKTSTTEDLGVHPDFVEAVAFAFFAKQTLDGEPSNLPLVTGAKGKRILGAVYCTTNQS